MKRVLIFSLAYYPRFIGGAEVAIKEITDRVAPEEIEFHMVTLRFDSELPRMERIGNVIVHRIGFVATAPSIQVIRKFPLHLNKHWYQLGAWLAALRLQRQYRFDATWAMMAHAAAIPAGLFKRSHPEIPYVLTLQEGDPPEYIEKLMRPVAGLFRQGFERADVLQPISYFLEAWGKRMGFRGESDVIPNAVDVARFSRVYPEADIARMRQQLGKQAGDIFLVTTSRLVHKNAVDDVIRALRHLPENVQFLIYGIGPDEAMLRALATTEGVDGRTHFRGQIANDDIPLLLAACDIFIRPSRSEGFGISFIEAMAAGMPVIATQEGGIGDFLYDAVRNPEHLATGWAVDRDAPEQIASVVRDILDDPVARANTTKAAAAMVAEKYDWGRIAQQMKEMFMRHMA